MRSALSLLLAVTLISGSCASSHQQQFMIGLDGLPTLPPPPAPFGWKSPLVLQPGIPDEVEICTWDGFSVLSCITMGQLRVLLKSRQRA